jgi:hypothetical protein
MSAADSPTVDPGYVLRLLFGLQLRVSRKAYVIAGFSLMLLKYVMDSASVYVVTGEPYSPLRFFSPLVSARLPSSEQLGSISDDRTVLLSVMAAYALVFMWIGVSMTVRRASTAGVTPWLGLAFLLPIFNIPLMLALAFMRDKEGAKTPPAGGFYRPHGPEGQVDHSVPLGLRSAMKGVVAGVLIGAAMIVVSIFGLAAYGAVLFFFTPFVMGTITAFLYNRDEQHGLLHTLIVSLMPILITAAGLLLLALEGVICIFMAAPLAAGISSLGALLGWAIAHNRQASARHSFMVALALPALAGVEAELYEPMRYEVISSIEIDAPPEQVWPNVIGFSELAEPSLLAFQVGVAYPVRARIDGEGVGAVRHCEFSTGPFVEPITRWEQPTRLSFDVSSQPPAMKHWSPFRHLHSPHIGDSIVSERGEFRLVALQGGRTRLEGSTWYELRMAPPGYWRFWSDGLIHAIHGRVLRHIKQLTEEREP